MAAVAMVAVVGDPAPAVASVSGAVAAAGMVAVAGDPALAVEPVSEAAAEEVGQDQAERPWCFVMPR